MEAMNPGWYLISLFACCVYVCGWLHMAEKYELGNFWVVTGIYLPLLLSGVGLLLTGSEP